MAVCKTINVSGTDVKFKASASVPRLYRAKFRKDIFKDFSNLKENSESDENFSIDSLETFENIAYIMAKHADPENVPNDPDEWLEQFNMFSIYEVLPKLIELWELNIETQSESKKNIVRLTEK